MGANQNDIAISVNSVSKTFKLPHERQESVKGRLLNFRKGKQGYEKQEVLKNISFEVKKGEFFGIVGRNGSGKSTLLKTIAQIYSPDSGDVVVNGRLVPFIELGVGFNPELTGRENVYLNGALLGFGRKEMDELYDEIVDFAELEKFMDQKLKNYSSGMQVRLAFSIAIRAKGDILLLDEVLAVGDEAFQRKCNEYFDEIKEDKKTVILVSHSMINIRRYCDRAIIIDDGEIINEGDIDDVIASYSLVNMPASSGSTEKASLKAGKKAEIINTTINGKAGDAIVNIDDPISLSFDFKLKEPKGVIAGVSIVKENKHYAAYYNTKSSIGAHTCKPNRVYRATLMIEPEQIYNGAYYIDIALYEDTKNGETTYLCKSSQSVRFAIKGGDEGRGGIINLQGNWSIGAGEKN